MKKIKLMRQTTVSECGLCCIAMVANYYGLKKSMFYYRKKYLIGRDGTSVKELYDILAMHNFDVNVYKCDKNSDFGYEDNKPYIMFCRDSHYVVVQKRKNKYIVTDPSSNQSVLTPEAMESMFSGVVILAEPNDSFKKDDDKYDDFVHVKNIITDNSILLVITVLLSMVTYAMLIAVPVSLQRIIDNASSIDTILGVDSIINIVIIALFFILACFVRNLVNVKLEIRMLAKISESTMHHLLKIPFSFFDNRSPGNILYRMGIIDHVRNALPDSLTGMLMDVTCVICIVIYIGMRFSYLIIPVFVLISVIGVYVLMLGFHSVRLQRESLNAIEKVDEIQTEIIQNIFQIKCMHLEPVFWMDFKSLLNRMVRCRKKEKLYSGFMASLYMIITIFTPIVFTLMAIVFSRLKITGGSILLIYSLVSVLMNYSSQLFNSFISLFELKAHLYYLNDLLDEEEEDLSGEMTIDGFEELEMRNVCFSYTARKDNPLINNVSLLVRRKEKVAVVGMTGVGKTTLVKLLAGMYFPTSGDILINSYSNREVSIENIRDHITIVPQSTILFNRTIRDNITLGDVSIKEDSIVSALKASCIWEDIERMPMKLDTKLSYQGVNFSGGQLQRLSIARAIVKKPELIIMDEATNSLDARTERAIFDNIKAMGMAIVVISHRLSTIVDSDRIYYMENDGGLSVGTHEQLFDSCESYRALFNKQFIENEIGDGGAL